MNNTDKKPHTVLGFAIKGASPHTKEQRDNPSNSITEREAPLLGLNQQSLSLTDQRDTQHHGQ